MKYNALSLFSSVGLAETYFDKRGIKVVVANEILKDRAMFHQHLYPESLTICGNILDKKIYNQKEFHLQSKSKNNNQICHRRLHNYRI